MIFKEKKGLYSRAKDSPEVIAATVCVYPALKKSSNYSFQ